MNDVSLDEFIEACRDRLTEEQIQTLDPACEYFQIAGSHFGLKTEGDRVWVSIAVGDIRGMLGLKSVLLKAKFERIGWMCRKDSPTYAWGRYFGAIIEDIGHKYADGSIAWRCIINTKQARRLTKDSLSVIE